MTEKELIRIRQTLEAISFKLDKLIEIMFSNDAPIKEQTLYTVKQYAALNPLFTESALRWQIFNAATNGMDDCQAIMRKGARVFIHAANFEKWLYSQETTPWIMTPNTKNT